jgi:hypothetical protein
MQCRSTEKIRQYLQEQQLVLVRHFTAIFVHPRNFSVPQLYPSFTPRKLTPVCDLRYFPSPSQQGELVVTVLG